MKTLYLDCFAGIAGDMFIGALLNLVPSHAILTEGIRKIKALDPKEYELIIEHAAKNGIAGINFDVKLNHHHEHDHEHEDGHAHESGHEYEHEHEHVHGHEYEHEHHKHGHEHEYEHAHEHIHESGHEHEHEHVHDHEHEHEHHEPGHEHEYEHEHEHSHEHEYEHEHEHSHEHEHEHHHRHLSDIESMIFSSELSERVKRESIRAFSILAEAEAHVHGTTPDKIHFHEVGAVDSIIDIVGAFILMEALNWPRVLCSPVNVGSGTVECAHGILPVPAPAAEYLLHGLPVFSSGSPMERTTPTGALLVKILADGFCSLPSGRIIASGFGLGNRESNDMPNVLRAVMIESGNDDMNGLVHEKIAQIECNIDDMNPQDYEPVIEKLFAGHALDVWTENIYMKKSRPGIKLCCLSKPDDTLKLSRIILENTTSQGVRVKEYDRFRLNWKIECVNTSLGDVHVKTTTLDDEILRRIPEYEDVKVIAANHGLSMYEARRMILREI